MRVLLNGVGRIGKAIFRQCLKDKNLEIVCINELNTNIDNIAYSVNYDSTYGALNDKFKAHKNNIKNTKSKIKILNKQSLLDINFKKYNIDIVIDSSGAKVDVQELKNLDVKAVFLTHPNKNADINVILGVNEKLLDKEKHKVISASSCNATALLPVLKLLDDKYKILYGDILTVHPMLNHQRVLDSACIGSTSREVACNAEFGRSATQNIIPSNTTTINACSFVMPFINEKIFSSSSLRVPTPTVGAINVCVTLKNNCSKDELIDYFKTIQKKQKDKVILNNFEALVSSDFEKSRYTSIIDHRFTEVIQNKMLKLVLWYDNEWGYASKVLEVAKQYK